MFKVITETISNKVKLVRDTVARFRLRLRYYASAVLLVSGIVYVLLGAVLLIASFLAMPVSLLALIPAIYLMCLGHVYWKSRTRKNMNALLWWEVPALIMFVLSIVLLCSDMFTSDSKMMLSMEAVALGIMACPGFFVITHGHSLFGPTAIPHEQLKEKYQNVVVKHIAEPTYSVCCETQEKSDKDFVAFFKFGCIAFSFMFAFLNAVILFDDYSYIKKPVPYEIADVYRSETKGPMDGGGLVLMCCHLAEKKAEPVYVFQTQPTSEQDTGWQCLCGRAHDPSDAVMVSVDKAVRLCPQLGTIISQKK